MKNILALLFVGVVFGVLLHDAIVRAFDWAIIQIIRVGIQVVSLFV